MLRKGDIGDAVASLQRQLIAAGFKITADGWLGNATEFAIRALQRRAGLVVDGIVGPKTLAALHHRDRNPLLLGERDLQAAADRLGVELAAIKAVNEVESRGCGFVDHRRPVILYERHVAYRLLDESGMDHTALAALAERYPNLLGEKRGGYSGGAAEWSRLTSARQILPAGIPEQACSWGCFQIMGYHFDTLGYASIDAFVAAMRESEAAQLDAFVRFVEADSALLKAMKARKWADFARLYNGPDYKANLYDVKLARAYERHQETTDETLARAA